MLSAVLGLVSLTAAVVLSWALLAPERTFAQPALRDVLAQALPASPPARQETFSAPQKQAETATRMVAVEWRIKKGQEEEFLEYWSTRSTIPDRSGLVGEFLNRVETREQYPWMVWEFNEGWTTFINIGIWREGADFQQQIGRFIDNSRPPLAFEADRRRRILLAPERWRIGNTALLKEDHPAVK